MNEQTNKQTLDFSLPRCRVKVDQKQLWGFATDKVEFQNSKQGLEPQAKSSSLSEGSV